MNRATPLGLLLVVALFASTGAAAYQYQQVQLLEAKAKRMDNQLLKANQQIHILRAKARRLNDELSRANHDLQQIRGQLVATRSTLSRTQSQLNETQTESQRRLLIILGQQENVDSLKRCLIGVVAEHVYFREGIGYYFRWTDSRDNDDLERAMDNLKKAREIADRIEELCSRAARLF